MKVFMAAGRPGQSCDVCGATDRPMLSFVPTCCPSESEGRCVLCVTLLIDAVTGWRMAHNVLQSLAVGDAGERFHHPERFVRPPDREKRQDRLDRAAARAARAVRVVDSNRAGSPQEMDR